MTSPTAPTAPPGTTPGQYTLTDLMNLFHQLAPLSSTTGSDDLNKAWLAAQAQMNSAMLSQETQHAQQAQALAQLTGYTAQGQSTLGEQQLQNEMQQAAQNRQQQLQMQTMQQTHQAALQALSQNWQTQEAINARAGQMALQQGQQQWQSGESAA